MKLINIHLYRDLIILKLDSRIIRLWYYDVNELKHFLMDILNRYSEDVGIVSVLNINNRNKVSNSYLRLVYSNWYKFVDGKQIENLLTNDNTENDTISLIINNKQILCFTIDDDLIKKVLIKLCKDHK